MGRHCIANTRPETRYPEPMKIHDYRDPRWPGALRDFYQTAIGQDLLGSIQHKLDEYLPSLFGYHAVQLGDIAKGHDLLRASAIRHRVGIDMDDSAPALRAHAGSLPLQPDSIDLAFLAHSLDFAV